jgi:ketosteroid isomerase-like protein
MKRLALLALVLVIAPLSARGQTGDDAAKQLAQKILDQGAALYDTKDAQAMAATYIEDAIVSYMAKDESTGQYKPEIRRGRPDIQALYEKLFENKNATTSRNNVEYAHMIGSDFLVIQGTFQPDTSNEGKIPFVQTRMKQGDKWLIANLQLFVLP